MDKLLLIDGNSILNRAFYGLPDLTTADGRHTNAVLGFLNIILRVIDDEKATHVCVAFDVKKPTFRHEKFAEYKGTRKPMPEELREQVPLIKEVLATMNVKTIERPGYEADDILGTLSVKGREHGFGVTVLSGDRDLLQLATDDVLVKLPRTKAGKTTIEEFYAKDVKEAYGVSPLIFIDMKGLMGDTSDNIPGVPGIGEKTAAKLLIEYGDMDGIYAAIDSMKPSKMKENLVNFKDQAYLSKDLATIKLDCDLDVSFDDMLFKDAFNKKVQDLFLSLEFKSLLNRFSEMKPEIKLDFETVFVDDFNGYLALIKKFETYKAIGFSFVENESGPVCVSLCGDEKIVYIVRFAGFITCDNVVTDILDLAKKVRLVCLDLKKELKNLALNDEFDVFDCGIAAYLLNPLRDEYSYDDLAKDVLGVSLLPKKELIGKQDINIFNIETPEISQFVSYLSLIPFMCEPELTKQLKDVQMFDLYKDIELPCVYTLYDMEQYGISVDAEELANYGAKLKSRIDELTNEIYAQAGKEFNINSTKQLGEVLFEDLELKSGKKTKTGYSTNVEVLEKLRGEHPIIENILEYRQLTKLNSTYVEGMASYIRLDGKIHSTFNQTVTVTGRISSTEPNLQNIPTRLPLGREIRKVFKPEEGYVFLDADYSQIELRVLAHISDDKTLIEAYHKDSDIHAITASEVFGVPMDQVDSLMRRRAKAVNFGIVYGISSFGLGQDLDISRKEAEGYIAKYFETYGGVKVFMDQAVAEAKDLGYSKTLYNRRRPLPELKSSNFMTRSFGERAAMNAPIQGTAADIIKIAMIRVNRELKRRNLKSRLILQIHDELMIETKIEELDEVRELLVSEMVGAANLSVPLIVDVHSGNSWYEAK